MLIVDLKRFNNMKHNGESFKAWYFDFATKKRRKKGIALCDPAGLKIRKLLSNISESFAYFPKFQKFLLHHPHVFCFYISIFIMSIIRTPAGFQLFSYRDTFFVFISYFFNEMLLIVPSSRFIFFYSMLLHK